MACIGPHGLYSAEDVENVRQMKAYAENVDYAGDKEHYRAFEQRNAGGYTYVVSAANERPKYSEGYFNCTGFVAVGYDERKGKNISVLSHEDPRHILRSPGTLSEFLRDVHGALLDLKGRSSSGTVDVAFFAGDYGENMQSTISHRASEGKKRIDDYRDVLKSISEQVREVLGMDMRIVVGPKEWSNHAVTVMFDTQRRRLYMYRPEQSGFDNNTDFRASQVDEFAEKFGAAKKRREVV